MDLNKLLIFKAIVESGSITKASEALKSHQPVVTRQIKSFENEVGKQLFIRTKKGIFLTDEGEIIYSLASNICSLVNEGISELNKNLTGSKGRLRVITTVGMINSWLINKLRSFLNEYPEVKIDIEGSNNLFKHENINTDVFVGTLNNEDENLEKVFLRSYHLKLYASNDYIKKFGSPKTFEELTHHKLLSFSYGIPSSFGDPDWFLKTSGMILEPYMNINSSFGLAIATKFGLGISALAEEYMKDLGIELVDLFPSDEGKKVDIYYIYHKKMKFSKRVKLLGEYLAK